MQVFGNVGCQSALSFGGADLFLSKFCMKIDENLYPVDMHSCLTRGQHFFYLFEVI
jgi:hypothetical protein